MLMSEDGPHDRNMGRRHKHLLWLTVIRMSALK